MSWQGIKRSLTRLARPAGDQLDQENQRRCFDQIYTAYNQLNQQVNQIQSHLQIFAIVWGGGVTTVAVTLPIPATSTNYAVLIAMSQNSGTWWITGRTKTGFTLNFVTAGAGGAFAVVVNFD